MTSKSQFDMFGREGRPRTIQHNGQIVFFDDIESLVLDMDNIVNSSVQVCRFNGHTKFHYSNLRHMYMVSCICKEKEYKLACLLHDVHEIITGDIGSPLAHWFTDSWKKELDDLKFSIDRVVAKQFNCPELIDPVARKKIKYYDRQMTYIEGRMLIPNSYEWFPEPELSVDYLNYESNSRVIHNWKSRLRYLVRQQERAVLVEDTTAYIKSRNMELPHFTC